MTSQVEFSAFAAYGKKEDFKPFKYSPRPLGKKDVDVKIHYCGMCASDIHQVDSGWGDSIYPIVPGHEIVGEIIGKGEEVHDLAIGDRIGIGAQCWSCHQCNQCTLHEETLCSKRVFTYNDRFNDGAVAYGGYAKHIRCDSRFAFKIPDNLPSESVAPLFCAGATVYSPLKHFGVTSGQRLGILGIGGLGHLAVKFGKALGCHVTAISSHADKEAECKKLGADKFLLNSDPNQMKSAERSLDVILSTINVNVNWTDYFNLIKPDGKLIFVGLPDENISLKANDFVSQRISICGNPIGSPTAIKEMLKLASEKNVVADVTVWPLEQVNEAFKNFREGKPHFRYVLKMTH